mgnify:CR=1 FL=1
MYKRQVQEYEIVIQGEVDLRRESANTRLTAEYFENSNLLYVPKVFSELSGTQTLTIEKINGVPITDFETLDRLEVDRKLLSERGVSIFFKQVFEDNFFHADMHPGNIFVDKRNTENAGYVAVDCAICGSLTNEERYTLARMLQAVIKEQYHSLAKLFINAGWVDKNSNISDLENTLRACCEPILEKPLSEI